MTTDQRILNSGRAHNRPAYVSDAVDWAREILARYEGFRSPPTVLTARNES